jgi:hypothetical protein
MREKREGEQGGSSLPRKGRERRREENEIKGIRRERGGKIKREGEEGERERLGSCCF